MGKKNAAKAPKKKKAKGGKTKKAKGGKTKKAKGGKTKCGKTTECWTHPTMGKLPCCEDGKHCKLPGLHEEAMEAAQSDVGDSAGRRAGGAAGVSASKLLFSISKFY